MSPEFKELKEKFEQLTDLIKDGRVGFLDVNELLIGFPKLNSFIEQKDGNHYIRLPKIYEWMAIFPSLKDLLTFKDSNFFLPVQGIFDVRNMFEKLILEKDGDYYVRCQEIKTNLQSCTFDYLEKKRQ